MPIALATAGVQWGLTFSAHLKSEIDFQRFEVIWVSVLLIVFEGKTRLRSHKTRATHLKEESVEREIAE